MLGHEHDIDWPDDSVEQRVARIRERLGEGGEIAQGVLREIFPSGIWLYPDPTGEQQLLAYALTAIENPAGLVDADGHALAEGFPRVYLAAATGAKKVVAGSGSRGRVERGKSTGSPMAPYRSIPSFNTPAFPKYAPIQ
jgi:hypothetical protein